jgi:ankyrin repeat protein
MTNDLIFLQNNARINCVDRHGQTALFYAAEHGHPHVVKYLLSMDADALLRFVLLE